MKNSIAFIFSSLLILLVLTYRTAAQQITPSLEFLTIGTGAKQLSSGEATTAMGIDGLNALVNPASLGAINQSMVSANYTLWIAGTEISSFSAVLLEKNQRLSFSFLSNSTSAIEIRDTPGESLSNANVEYLALTAAYSYAFSPLLTLGLSASYLNEQYIVNYANGYSLGFGMFSSLYDNRVRIGAAVNHIGEMQKLNERKSKLPTQARIGIDADVLSLAFPGDRNFPMLFSITTDFIHYLELLDSTVSDNHIIKNEQALLTGVRILAADLLAFQASYRFLIEGVQSWSFGLGIYQGDFSVDFAFLPFGTGFNPAYSLGMRYSF